MLDIDATLHAPMFSNAGTEATLQTAFQRMRFFKLNVVLYLNTPTHAYVTVLMMVGTAAHQASFVGHLKGAKIAPCACQWARDSAGPRHDLARGPGPVRLQPEVLT